MRWLTLTAISIGLVLGLLLSVFNHQHVILNYYWGAREFPLSVVIMLAFGCGFLVAALGGWAKRCKLRILNWRLQRKLAKFEQVKEQVVT